MDDGFDDGGGVPASEADGRRWLRYSAQVARRIVARTARGETLASIGRDPEMPAARVVQAWLSKRPEFAAAMREARAVAGAPLRGRRSSYCAATASAIVVRLCEGEAMRSILAGADMPAYSTVYRWLLNEPEFASAVALARRIQGDRLAEEGWELALAGTPETAYLTEVRLKHLRWYAGKLSPRKYGAFRPFDVHPEDRDENGRKRLDILYRHFEIEVGEDGVKRVVSWCPNPDTGEAEREPEKAAPAAQRWTPPVKRLVEPKAAAAADAADDDDYWRPDPTARPGDEWL
jgi:hypothetical protein